jgi:hypothetical protein
MDSLQKQVIGLSHKVDGLYQIIDQLNHKVSEALSDTGQTPVKGGNDLPLGGGNGRYPNQRHSSPEPVMAHKDVLSDVNSCDKYSHQSSEKELSPEIQIQRLTAQLTAAYNRIAALEEQLLARRIHS